MGVVHRAHTLGLDRSVESTAGQTPLPPVASSENPVSHTGVLADVDFVS